MKTVQLILYIFIFYMVILRANGTLFGYVKDMLHRKVFDLAKNNTDGSVNIIIVKRDVASTIKKRSEMGKKILSEITKPNDLPVCSDDQLMIYLAELQAINPESIINLSTTSEIYLICKQISDNLENIDDFLQTCTLPTGKDLYVQLIKGVDKLYDVLCENQGDAGKGFKKHFECLRDLHTDFETCFGPPDWTEDNSKRDLCNVYKDIADCYYIKAAQVCGKEAAISMKKIASVVVNSIIPFDCPNVRVNPYVEDAMPDNAVRLKYNEILLVISMVVLNLAWYVQTIKSN